MAKTSRFKAMAVAGVFVAFAVVMFLAHDVDVALALCGLALLWLIADLVNRRSLQRLPDPDKGTDEGSERSDHRRGARDRPIR